MFGRERRAQHSLPPAITAPSPCANRSSRGLVLAADAAGAKRACVGADLLEGAGQCFAVGVGEVLGEVSFDSVSVVAAGAFHRFGALVGEDDEDRASVVVEADAA